MGENTRRQLADQIRAKRYSSLRFIKIEQRAKSAVDLAPEILSHLRRIAILANEAVDQRLEVQPEPLPIGQEGRARMTCFQDDCERWSFERTVAGHSSFLSLQVPVRYGQKA